ncbi:MAG: hypothetical protein JST19_13745 [Bacteroidetes bacterium]|nr:hypothetical protein [Bacteroidota bacterium]
MPKSSKRFVLSTDKVNSHGFRVIVSGIDIANFLKNPVMYWMHIYPSDKNEDVNKGMPIGYWDDVQRTATELSAIPVFDDNDELAMKLYHKVEHGTLRAASVGLIPIEVDTNKANWAPGQTLPTFLRSRLGEASLVDRGSDSDAVALSANGKILKLSDEIFKGTDMKTNDQETPDSNDAAQFSAELLAIVQNAVNAGKLTRSEADKMLKIANNSPAVEDSIKGVIKAQPIKPENISGKFHHRLISLAATKSYDEIKNKESGGLNDLMYEAPELYKAKFFEKFGRLPAAIPTRY